MRRGKKRRRGGEEERKKRRMKSRAKQAKRESGRRVGVGEHQISFLLNSSQIAVTSEAFDSSN